MGNCGGTHRLSPVLSPPEKRPILVTCTVSLQRVSATRPAPAPAATERQGARRRPARGVRGAAARPSRSAAPAHAHGPAHLLTPLYAPPIPRSRPVTSSAPRRRPTQIPGLGILSAASPTLAHRRGRQNVSDARRSWASSGPGGGRHATGSPARPGFRWPPL